MLTIRNIQKKYSRKIALNNIELSLENKVYGLLGPNGSGKTTLLRIITGLIDPTHGDVLFNGRNRRTFHQDNISIGYLPQKFGVLKELTVYQQMVYFANVKRIPIAEQKQTIERSIEAVNLEDRLKNRCGSLSGGMIRRMGVAQAIMGNPDLLLFDEPTAGLDPEERLRFKSVLKNLERNCPVVLSTHIVEDVESVCDQIVVLHEGTILANDRLDSIIKLADGRVFETQDEISTQLEVPYFTLRYIGNDPYNRRTRILLTGEEGATQVSDEKKRYLQPCQSTIEDGYMYLIKQVHQP